MLVMMPSYIILLGYIVAGALRGLLTGIIVISISFFLQNYIFNISALFFHGTVITIIFIRWIN